MAHKVAGTLPRFPRFHTGKNRSGPSAPRATPRHGGSPPQNWLHHPHRGMAATDRTVKGARTSTNSRQEALAMGKAMGLHHWQAGRSLMAIAEDSGVSSSGL